MYNTRSGRKGICVFILGTLLCVFLLTLRQHHKGNRFPKAAFRPVLEDPVELVLTEGDVAQGGSEAAHNATLGFQKILALSARSSWRTRGLGKISMYAGLQIDIIEPVRSDTRTIEDFLALGPEKATKPDRGSALAWLGHLAVLQNAVASGSESTLIVEDDVDFDVAIKPQMQKLANAVQYFTNTSQDTSPYGSAWDVLWLGHCGESWDRARSSLQYPDSSRIGLEQYIGWKEISFGVIRDDHRLIQWASGPTCTFAYAVTLNGARKILDLASKGRSTAFDTELSALCVFGKLRCITVTPQLFVHYVPNATSEDYVSEIDREMKNGERPVDDTHLDLVMGHTQNIVKSARCMAIFGRGCLPDAKVDSKDDLAAPPKARL